MTSGPCKGIRVNSPRPKAIFFAHRQNSGVVQAAVRLPRSKIRKDRGAVKWAEGEVVEYLAGKVAGAEGEVVEYPTDKVAGAEGKVVEYLADKVAGAEGRVVEYLADKVAGAEGEVVEYLTDKVAGAEEGQLQGPEASQRY